MADKASDKPEGEGDRAAAERYNQDQREFVKSGKVDQAAAEAGRQSEKAGRQAEKAAGARAKEHDTRENRDHKKPAS